MTEQLMSLAALTDDTTYPTEGVQYAVVVGDKSPQVYGDQSWVAGGFAAKELSGRTVRRKVTVAYGEWEPVPPPLPPEPEALGAVVRVEYSDGSHRITERVQSRDDFRWTWSSGVARWSRVADDAVSVTVLVPAPEPVELPWHDPYGLEVLVSSRAFAGPLAVLDGGARYTADVARAKAAALLSAADEAERANG